MVSKQGNMDGDLKLFMDLVDVLLESEKEVPVVKPIPYEELPNHLDLELTDDPMVDEEFLASISELIRQTPKTASKLFFNQLFGGRHGKAVIGELLAVLLNNSMYTYKVAGPHVNIENTITQHIIDKIGFPSTALGTFAAGGSMTNFMGMVMARDAKDPKCITEGTNPKLTVYTSEYSHYSVSKNAALCGIGRNKVRYIETDEHGKMDVAKLIEKIEADIANGMIPCMVNATAGTTVLGVFDPISKIAEVCKKHNIWLHVDGAYCGASIFSEKYKYLIEGVDQADTFTLNAHKMLSTPLSCSIIVAKNKKHLYDSFSNEASYLYQTDTDDINPGKISFQCGRRNDALKFWTLWKAVGTKGLERIVDTQFELAQYARDYVADDPRYTLYNGGDSVAVCFNYKDIDPKALCNELYEEGEIMVGYGSSNGKTFVRFVTVNAGNTIEDIKYFFERLEAFAEKKMLVSN